MTHTIVGVSLVTVLVFQSGHGSDGLGLKSTEEGCVWSRHVAGILERLSVKANSSYLEGNRLTGSLACCRLLVAGHKV